MNFYEKENPDKIPQLIYENYINQKVSDGIFLELGAFDGILGSNTLFLEKELGFNGVLIEPVTRNFNYLKRNRPKCTNLNWAVLNECSHGEHTIQGKGLQASLTDKQNKRTKNFHESDKTPRNQLQDVRTKKLSTILKELKVEYIDFWSLDVEGSEFEVLKSMDWHIPVGLICIEMLDVSCKKQQSNNNCSRRVLQRNGFELQKALGRNEIWVNTYYPRIHKLYNPNKPYKGNVFSKIKKIFKK